MRIGCMVVVIMMMTNMQLTSPTSSVGVLNVGVEAFSQHLRQLADASSANQV